MRSVFGRWRSLSRSSSSSSSLDARVLREEVSTRRVLSKFQAVLKSVLARSAIATESEYDMIRSTLLEMEEGQGSRAVIGRSTAFEGGSGVFANRDLKEGEFVSLYAGEVFPQPPISLSFNDIAGKATTIIPEVDSNDYIINLGASGAGYIDGNHELNDNWRCGQMINHPPQGTPTNVMMVEFLWSKLLSPPSSSSSSDEEDRLRNIADKTNQLHQGLWYITETGEKIQTPSLNENKEAYYLKLAGAAMVTSRAVKQGEELWFDYELNEDVMSDETAQWYAPVPPFQ